MWPEVMQKLAMVIPILAVTGTFVLIGFKGWANHLLRMRQATGGDNEHLTEAVQRLTDEVSSMREDVAELHERVDFNERILSEVRSRNAIGPGGSA